MTSLPEDKLAKIFGDAEGLGYLDPKYGPTMHDRVRTLYVDMMLDLAAAQHEVAQLKQQREATRLYLGFAPTSGDDALGKPLPADVLRGEVKRILDEIGTGKQILCIKELRRSDPALQAWMDLGNHPLTSTGIHPSMSLKDAKDIIDFAINGQLWLGPGRGKASL